MKKYVIEILQHLNESPDNETAKLYWSNSALRTTLFHAFDATRKFNLPDGDPPYREDAAPLGMSPGNYNMETQRFYVFCRADLAPLRRESLFVQLLEGIHPSEAKMLLAVKDQDLGRLFPNITFEFVNAAQLVQIPVENAAVAPVKSQPRGKGRPPGAKNKPAGEEVENTTKDPE